MGKSEVRAKNRPLRIRPVCSLRGSLMAHAGTQGERIWINEGPCVPSAFLSFFFRSIE